MMGAFFSDVRTLPATPCVGGSGGVEPDNRLSRVLVVDGEEVVAMLVRSVLEREGCRVSQAGTSEEALRLFFESVSLREPYDLVLIDMSLGEGGDGEALLAGMREAHADFLAVLMTGDPWGGRAAGFEALGFHAMLPKPFTMQALIECVRPLRKRLFHRRRG